MERQFKGIWIPAEIWEATDLTWNEKIVLMEIDSFTAAGKDCYISDDYIGELVGVSPRTASSMVSKLVRLGYVIRTRSDGRHRFLKSAIFAEQPRKICEADTQNLRKTYNTITDINIEKEEINKEERFRRPTVEEVRAYCEERRNGIDAEAFVAFYESNGWRVGRNPMKDWRAAVRTWEAKRKGEPKPRTGSPKKEQSLTDYYRNLMAELHKTQNDDNGIDEQ